MEEQELLPSCCLKTAAHQESCVCTVGFRAASPPPHPTNFPLCHLSWPLLILLQINGEMQRRRALHTFPASLAWSLPGGNGDEWGAPAPARGQPFLWL